MSLLQIIVTCAISVLAGYVGASWQRVSAFSLVRKRQRDLEITISGLESSFESLMESHHRLRSRAGMREIREKQAAPKLPETKAEARARIFGNAQGPEAAKRLQAMGADK